MAKNGLLTAYEEYMAGLENDQERAAFQPFYEAVKQADDAMSALHRRDRYGRIRLLGAEERERLMQLHEALGLEAERLLADGAIPVKRKDAVRKIAAIGAANYRHLRSYDPKERMTLPELLEDVRTLTIDTRGTTLKEELGSEQNKRQPLSFLDDKGRVITGLFTKKKYTNVWSDIKSSMELLPRRSQMQEKKESTLPKAMIAKRDKEKNWNMTPRGEEIVRSFMERLDSPKGAKALGLPEDADHSARLAALYLRLISKVESDYRGAFCKLVSELFSEPGQTLSPEQAQQELGRWAEVAVVAIGMHGTAILNNHTVAKIHDGARMDSRNGAMSAVAELLNVPNLVAKSVPMKLIGADGKTVEGSFMMEAQGVDLNNLRADDVAYPRIALSGMDGRALKSIADLQVLDYICGNTDRHSFNFTYQFDEQGKFIGIQAFDNDTAFGILNPKFGDFVAHLTLPENMMAVSESMYQRLNQLTPEMLKFSLRGFGLTEEELDAAVQRMQNVKEAIEKGKEFYTKREEQLAGKKPKTMVEGQNIRVLKDEEWKEININELHRSYESERYVNGKLQETTTGGNTFSKAFSGITGMREQFLTQKKEYSSLRSAVAIGAGNRAHPSGVDEELKKARQMEGVLKNRTKRFHSSGNYEKMQTAVKNYRVFQERLQARLKEANEGMQMIDALIVDRTNERELFTPMDGVVTVDDLNEMQRLSREMRDAAKDYLVGKGILPRENEDRPRRRVEDYEDYTKDRIEAAKILLELGTQGAKIREAEIETAARNQHRAQEEINRRFGDLLEQQGWQPPEPEPRRTDSQLSL